VALCIRSLLSQAPITDTYNAAATANDAAISDSIDSTASPYPAALCALEWGEVESHMHRALLLLCAVRRRPAAKAQLQCTSALKSLLLLLRCGSPRLQRSVLLLLSSALPGAEPAAVEAALPTAWRTASVVTDSSDSCSGASAAARKQQRTEGLIGVLFSAVQLAYSVVDLPVASHATATGSATAAGDGAAAAASTAVPLLRVGCGRGYGAGRLDLCFADQCAALLRTLLRATLWRERVARALLVRIHAARSAVKQNSTTSSSTITGAIAAAALAAGAAAVAVLAGSSGALYPGAPVKSRRAGARGTLVHCEPGAAKAAAVFAGAESGGCETVRVRDLEVCTADAVNPDTASQPVTAQLATLTQALLESASTSSSSSTDSSAEQQQHMQAAEARLLSLALSALLQQVAARPQAVAAVCADNADAPALLPALLRAAVQASPLPCLASVSEVRKRWRAGVARVLSAHRIGAPYTCLAAVQQRAPPVPLPETPPAQKSSKLPAAAATAAAAAAVAKAASDSAVHSDSTAGDSATETASCQWQRAATHGAAVVAPAAAAAAAAVNTGSSDADMCIVVEFNDGVADGSSSAAVAAVPSADDECASVCDGEEVRSCCATNVLSKIVAPQAIALF
jgi:hypothetical protein